MDCTKAGELMMRFMDHMLTDDEAKELGLHMDVCPTCKEDFLVYDIMMTGFEEMPIVSAPDGFEEAVMQKVAALPPTKEKCAAKMLNGIEHIVYATSGTFVVLAVVTALAFLNWNTILVSLFGSENFNTVTNALASFSANVGSFFTGIATVLHNSMTDAMTFLADSRYILLGILAVLVSVAFAISNRSNNKEKVKI